MIAGIYLTLLTLNIFHSHPISPIAASPISGIRKKAAASRTNIVVGGMLPHRAFVLLSLLSLALATQLYRYGTDEGDQVSAALLRYLDRHCSFSSLIFPCFSVFKRTRKFTLIMRIPAAFQLSACTCVPLFGSFNPRTNKITMIKLLV